MKSVNMVLHNFLKRAFSFLVKCWYIELELSNIQIAFRSLYKREVWMKFLSYRITILSDLCIDTSIIGRWMNLAKIHQTPKTPLKYEGMSLVLVFLLSSCDDQWMIDTFVDSQQLMFRVFLKHTFHIKLDL